MEPTQKKLKVVIIGAEIHPYAKVGGLADVLGALPKGLRENDIDPVVIIPYYSKLNESKYEIEKAENGEFAVGMAVGPRIAKIYHATIPYTDIPVFFIGNEEYFEREGIYTDPKTGEGYPDNLIRFTFFCRAAYEMLRRYRIQPDIIHANDYQTALMTTYLKTKYASDDFFRNTSSVFSIHNLAYQGIETSDILDYIGLGHEMYYPTGPLEFYGKVNFMKAGIYFADKITTVSPTYAEEIQTPEYGYGLEGVLRSVNDRLTGILNGVDYTFWNPETDIYLDTHFSAEDLSGKAKLKEQLFKEAGLDMKRIDRPVIGMVSRLVDQKGFDILKDAIENIIDLDVSLVFLGTGQKSHEEYLESLAKEYPGKVSAIIRFADKMAHLIEAGSDMFLMPSKYEPCGLNQMYSLKYGTVPIVRKTGGLADTIIDINDSDEGVGFNFTDYDAASLYEAVRRAVFYYQNDEKWTELVIRGMKKDYSWTVSAAKYAELYRSIAK